MKRRLAIHIGIGMFAIPFVVAVAVFASLFSHNPRRVIPHVPVQFEAVDRERRIGIWVSDASDDFSRCLDVVLILGGLSTANPASLEPVNDMDRVGEGLGQVAVPKGSTLRVLHTPTPECHHRVLIGEVPSYHFPFVLPMRLVVLLAALTLGGAVLAGELSVWLARRLRPSIARG